VTARIHIVGPDDTRSGEPAEPPPARLAVAIDVAVHFTETGNDDSALMAFRSSCEQLPRLGDELVLVEDGDLDEVDHDAPVIGEMTDVLKNCHTPAVRWFL